MGEEDLIQWVIEKRLEMLSNKEGLPRQEETIAKIEKILDDGLKPGFQTKIGAILDGIRWGENDIYLEGFKDGVRIMRRLNAL